MLMALVFLFPLSSSPPLPHNGNDLILASTLLTSPPGIPEVPPPESTFPGLRDAIHKLAIEWEIMDSREARYVLTRPDDFDNDLNMLRRRYQELRDAPPISDSFRFPDRNAVNEMVRFNRAYRKHLDDRQIMETDRTDALRTVMAETDRLYKVWDSVRDARCEFYYITVRRQALQKLRGLVGEEAYFAATLPPNVPTWRFNELK